MRLALALLLSSGCAAGSMAELAAMKRRGDLAALTRTLEDELAWRREAAARALGELGGALPVERLAAIAMDRDEVEQVRVEAAFALGRAADRRGVETLTALALAPDTPSELVIEAVFGLCGAGEGRRIAALAEAEDVLVADGVRACR